MRDRLAAVLTAAGLSLVAASQATATTSEPIESAVLLDVPFLPQPPELCGGAAAAMVRRYWGEDGVHAEDYARLVDEQRHGIAAAELLRSFRELGWRASALRASPRLVRRELSMGRPLIALVGERASALHYVVLVGWSGARVVVQDPALGPLRVVDADVLFSDWEASDFWALLALPPSELGAEEEAPRRIVAGTTEGRASDDGGTSLCRELVHEAVARPDDESAAEDRLRLAAGLCPSYALAARELGALRFREERWGEAAEYAERSVHLDAADAHAWSLLAASRYLEGDHSGALEAWNAVGEPEIDRVRIRGLTRTRQDIVYGWLSLTPGTTLSARELAMAVRRAGALPTVEDSRISFVPLPGGRAEVVAHLVEEDLFDPIWPLVMKTSVDAVIDRRARVHVSSPVGGGEALSVRARWWPGRPAIGVALSSPGALGLPGIVTLSGYAEQQSYDLSGAASRAEERRGARLEVSEWVTPTTRTALSVGLDRWRGEGGWLFARGAIDRRLFGDHVSLRADVAHWFPAGSGDGFGEQGASILARYGAGREWALRGRLDARRVDSAAPLGVWPGAGTGRARPLLLRGYPLLDGSVIAGEGIAPALLHASVEAERRVWSLGMAQVGLAAFYDWARTSGRPDSPRRTLYSFGLGARIHALGDVLRVDGAVRPDGRVTLSAAWVESW